MSDEVLTKESEAIIRKLLAEADENRLTEEELAMVRKGLAVYEGLGVLANVVIKAAAVVAALAALYQYIGNRGH